MRLKLAVTATLFFVSAASSHALGARPQPQAWRSGSASSPNVTSFGIYVKTSDVDGFHVMASKLAQWLPQAGPPELPPYVIRDLQELGTHPGENEIVIGNPAVSSRVQDLATQHGLVTTDLGTEGYMLDSRVPPDGTCAWRVLIIANDPAGARFGVATLVDEIVSMSFPEIRVRDYPDRPQRAFLYGLGSVGFLDGNQPYDVPAWMAARKADMDELAKRGINTVYFQTNDWFGLKLVPPNNPPHNAGYYADLRRGARIRELFDYCRKLRMEPNPWIVLIEPPSHWAASGSLLREGVLTDDLFTAAEGEALTRIAPPFDHPNLDWSNPAVVDNLPSGWSRLNDPTNAWQWNAAEKQLFISGYSGPAAYVRTRVPIEEGFFYVLRVVMNTIQHQKPSDCPPDNPCCPNVHVRATTTQGGNGWIKYCFFKTKFTDGQLVYECPFLAPVGSLPEGEVYIYFSTDLGSNVSLAISSVSLERRGGTFVNLLRDTASTFAGQSFPGLPVVVTSPDDGTLYEEDHHYVVEDYSPDNLDWLMPSDGPVSRIRWLVAPPPTGTVRVRCTLGVPAQRDNGNATTVCFSNGNLYAMYDDVFNDLFDAPGFGMNPKYVHLDMDELRGINRCGRCDVARGTYGRGLTNKESVVDHLNRLQAQINGKPGGANARVVVFADMLNPYHNGGDGDLQYAEWLGQPGATGVPANEMSSLDAKIVMHMWNEAPSQEAMLAGWPGPTRSVLAGPESTLDPDAWGVQDCWYQSNALGFGLFRYVRYGLPTTSDDRLFDYAWKRYRQPDATMHGYKYATYFTDDHAQHQVNLVTGAPLTIVPYGRPLARDQNYCTGPGSQVDGASIAWGDGTTTSVTPAQLNSGSFNHTYSSTGLRTVTLSVIDAKCSGGGVDTTRVTIPVNVTSGGGGGCTKNCPTQSQILPGDATVDLSPGIRAIVPSPFRTAATIHFTVPQNVNPEIQIYDVRGRCIREVRLAEHPAGAWQWSWDGQDNGGRRRAPGVYFLRMRLGAHVESRRLVCLAP